MKPWLKKITSVVSVAALSSSMIAANLTVAVAEEGDLGDIDGDPIVSITHLSAKAQEDAMKAEEESLNTITGGETVTVIIELETPGVIEAGYTPGTAEAAAYANGLKADQAAMNAQIESLGAQTVEIENKINGTAEPAPVFEVQNSYVNVMNGFAVEVPFGMLPLIEGMEGVKNVFVSRTYEVPETTYEPEMYTSTEMISSNFVNNYGYDGNGTLIGILDTGLDIEHEAFANEPANAKVTEAFTNPGLHASGTTYKSAKIPFAYDYAGDDDDVYPRGSNHGVHVAGTVAGKTVDAEGEVTFFGVAPEAQLAIFKVFGDQGGGARDADLLEALEDVVIIKPDVVNLSLGSPAGFSSDLYSGDQTMSDVYNRVYENGTILAISAGNEYYMGFNHLDGSRMADAENPNTGLVGSPSTYRGPTSVASIENTQLITDYFLVDGNYIMYSDSAESAEQKFSSLNDQAPLDYVLVPGYGEEADFEGVDVEGKIAVISRGSTTFVSKQLNAAAAGAAGAIIYNNQPGTITMQIQQGSIPCIAITQADAQILIDSETKQIAELGHDHSFDNDQAYQMSDFSSWGTTDDLKLKPEITAPGGHIYSALPGNQYGDMSGTSMAAPHMAGLAALETQRIDKLYEDYANDLQKNDIVNAMLMSTAIPVPYPGAEGLFYSPRKQGAGLANAALAISSFAYLTVDGTEGNRPKIELGDDPMKSGVYNMSFTANNWSSLTLGYNVEVYVQTDEVVDGKITTAPHALSATVTGAETVQLTYGASVRVNLTVELTDESKAYLDENFPNGGFVDGFVILEADGEVIDEEEGLENTIDLSIPFVGFYGDWDAAPHLDETLENVENAKMAGTGAIAYFGYKNYYQNPKVGLWPFIGQNFYAADWDYFAQNVNPDHCTIASDSQYRVYVDFFGRQYLPYLIQDASKNTGIWYLVPSLLRGVKWWSVDIKDSVTGEPYFHDEYSENLGKYYDQADGPLSAGMIYLAWGGYNMYSDTFEALPEGTKVDLILNVAADQNSRVETQTLHFTIDNTAPEIKGYEDGNIPVDLATTRSGKKYLMFTARDNYFLANLEVYDSAFNYIYGETFDDVTAGKEYDYAIDVTDSDAEGTFYVFLEDYTEFETYYEISADTSLVLTPSDSKAAVGSEVKFSVKDSNKFALENEQVEWTVEGAESADTAIKNGVLTIGKDETARTLTVNATYGAYTGSTTVTVLQYYNVDLTVGEGGTAELSESGSVLETTRVNVKATPAEDYDIDQILVNGTPVQVSSTGTAQFVVQGDTTVEVTFKAVIKDLTIVDLQISSDLEAGKESNLTIVSAGGTEPYQYKFTMKTADGWKTVQNYSDSAVWTWTPDVIGKVKICAYVKDANGTVVKQHYDLTIAEQVAELTLTVDTVNAAAVGDTITIKGLGEGGKAPLKYKMTAKIDGQWKTVNAYSENSEFTWTFDKAGTQRFCVYVIDSNKTVVKKEFSVKVTE